MEQWMFMGSVKFEDTEAWLITFKVMQSFPKARILKNGKIVQLWWFTREGEAYVEPESRMPYKIEVTEKVSWVDYIPYNRTDSKSQYQILRHNFINHFSLKR